MGLLLIKETYLLETNYRHIFVFYAAETWLRSSGVLAVVVLGVTLSAEKSSISPEVEVSLVRYTVIFNNFL